MPGKREEYLTWEESFMGVAMLMAGRSKDPSTIVGACIVKDNRIVSTGYNGLTESMSDDEAPWNSIGELTGELEKTKNPWVLHAERNAVYNYRGPLADFQGSTLYVTFFPCYECAKTIVQVGIKKVVWLRMYSYQKDVEISTTILRTAGVEIVQYNPNVDLTKEEAQEPTLSMQKILKKYYLNKRIAEKRHCEKLFNEYLNEKYNYSSIHFDSSISNDETIVLRKKMD